MPIRVLLVDDHPVVRRGLRALLDSIDGLVVVGEAADGDHAIREAQLNRPDVVLMDLQMPTVDGVTATERLRLAAPQAAVLVLTMYDDEATVAAALTAGASGYLLKGADQDEIVRAITAVAAGQTILGATLDLRLLSGPAADAPKPFPTLSEREHQILELLSTGLTTTAIARRLHLAPKTVSNQLTTIFSELGVTNRSQAIILARDAGLGQQ